MIARLSLSFDEAFALADGARQVALADGGPPVAIAVADPDGMLIVVLRMDGSSSLAVTVAINKAITSGRLGTSSSDVGAMLVRPGQELASFGDPRLTGFIGGVPVLDESGVPVGGIGVSGRTEEEDEKLASAGLDQLQLKPLASTG